MVSGDKEVDGQRDRVRTETLAQHRQGFAVPGQTPVVVARQDHQCPLVRGDEGGQRRGEPGVGVENGADLGWPGQQLESVTRDHEGARTAPPFKQFAEVGLDRPAGLGGHGRQVEVADQHRATTLRDGDLEQIGHVGRRGHGWLGGSVRLHLALGGRWWSRCRFCHSVASGRRIGKRMTSRIDVTSASSMTSRSMPMPMPDVGGRPYSSALHEGSVGRVGLEVPGGGRGGLGREALLLLLGHVELAVPVGQLLGVDHELEAVSHGGVIGSVASQGADLDREAADEHRIQHGALE